ncbi:SAF domain-containing protein [Kibdelosporangium philippinense]|uniref:SAF domain-containing protein n=2 Tax=Kibdelosporangium philippinense TaxID=211113 RepID=A0ABS8ZQE4_9PSEU|nr:SAF domain-containing protein [Kibdelosporangium philippinense]MCE7009944.1 SAF domain-containing protein [Kibdelosporangium philippinense]
MRIQTDGDRPSISDDAPWVNNGKKPETTSRLRAAGRRRSLPYLLLGVLLIVACTAAFLLISLNSGDRQPVLALARPVTVGQVLSAQDLRLVNVAVDPGVGVIDAGQAASMVGQTMSVSLPAGALLTPESVGIAAVPIAGQAVASLALKAGQFPPETAPGSRVAVVFVPNGGAAASQPVSDAVWSGVVTSVTSALNEQVTVVSVQLTEVAARQVAAVPAGQLSLVLLSGGGR